MGGLEEHLVELALPGFYCVRIGEGLEGGSDGKKVLPADFSDAA